ncbi:MAG: hypothetical protein KKB50_13185 [Planctomycetes bacterium]|nr:hypothetical protein [Planctomycetota bacterium]
MITPDTPTQRAPTAARTWLDAHRIELERQRNAWLAAEARWSSARLVTFLIAALVWIPLRNTWYLAAAASALGLSGFVGAVLRHLHMRAQRELGDLLLIIADETRQRCDGRVALIRSYERPRDGAPWYAELTPVLDAGPTWPLTEQERDDLDFYAPPVGIFGLLNRTSTQIGACRLRDTLENPCLSSERILARQAAVRWLAEHTPARLRLLAALAALRDEDHALHGFAEAVRGAQRIFSSGAVRGLRLWTALTILFIALGLVLVAVGHTSWWWGLPAALALNSLIWQRIHHSLGDTLKVWENVVQGASGLLVATRQGAADLPAETDLRLLRERFAAVTPSRILPSLARRVGWSESGGPLHTVFNWLFFYDLHVSEAILSRAVPHRAALLAGVSAVADLEVLLSLACPAWEQPITCYSEPVNAASIDISGGVHPLIPPERVVANDVKLSATTRMWIVTGSNMSGKSTLLRMTAVNMLFAQLGTTALARAMRWSPGRLMTDLRARDSLPKDESYFLAEVRQLRRMVLPGEGDTPLFGLIDEPFRGTNSEEQDAASHAVVQHLVQTENLFMLATHDRKLTELADGSVAQNFHLREDLGADGLVFDYLLRPGPARTRNALRILEREGYPAVLMDRAHGWLAREAGPAQTERASAPGTDDTPSD